MEMANDALLKENHALKEEVRSQIIYIKLLEEEKKKQIEQI